MVVSQKKITSPHGVIPGKTQAIESDFDKAVKNMIKGEMVREKHE